MDCPRHPRGSVVSPQEAQEEEGETQVKVFIAVIAFAAYFAVLFRFALTYAETGSAPGIYLAVAAFTFLVFAVITVHGIFRWARKHFPQKRRRHG